NGVYTRFLTNLVLIEFVFGMIIYAIYRNYRYTSAYLPGALLIVAVFLFIMLNHNDGVFTGIRIIDYGIPSFLICLSMTLLEKPIAEHKFLPLQMLGDSSYSLYLLHPFVLSGFILIFDLLGFLNEKLSYVVIGLMCVSAVASGYLCYTLVELKINKKLKFMLIKST
ncbi:acyltransferase family protein, partial [bacterium]|nr:acyltransferase family protein [bacterium]